MCRCGAPVAVAGRRDRPGDGLFNIMKAADAREPASRLFDHGPDLSRGNATQLHL
jgi:hypothetical protein